MISNFKRFCADGKSLLLTTKTISLNKVIALSFVLLASQTMDISSSYAAESVGEAVRIKNRVTASNGNRTLSKSDKVFAEEKIRAAKNSNGQLILKDNSKVIIGENSSVSLDNFVVSKGGIAKGTFKITKGALRLISGNGAKGKYKIKTPVATIGVRGTALDVFVRRSGETDIILYNGTIQACSSVSCITSRRVCDIVNIKPSGAVTRLPSFRYNPNQKDEEDTRYSAMWPQGGYVKSHQVREWVCKTRAANDFLNRRNEYLRLNEEDESVVKDTPKEKAIDDTPTDPNPYPDDGSCTETDCTD